MRSSSSCTYSGYELVGGSDHLEEAESVSPSRPLCVQCPGSRARCQCQCPGFKLLPASVHWCPTVPVRVCQKMQEKLKIWRSKRSYAESALQMPVDGNEYDDDGGGGGVVDDVVGDDGTGGDGGGVHL